MKRKLGEFLLNWVYHWAQMTDGVIGVLTFSQVKTRLGYYTAIGLARYRAGIKNIFANLK